MAGFDAEAYLNSLEPIGWKLGLERMEMLSDELGRPQDSFATIHVVGTNGKSSVSRMIAAICEAHGYRAGSSLSPHLAHWSERVVVSGSERPELFAECVRRTAEAAAAVNSRLEGEEVTQFELATAAAFLTLAEAGVQVAAIEAGLGGRLDATNSIDSLATVLTSIGLDHTEFLGETETEIAGEKLAVLRPGTTLILGPVSDEVRELAHQTASERDCELREITPAVTAGASGIHGIGGFQRLNFSVAEAAAACFLGEVSRVKAEEAVASLVIHGRLEQIGQNPLVLADVAHNPAGARALASSLPELTGAAPVVGVIGVLADKDAPGMLAELAGSLDAAVFTGLPEKALTAWGRPGARAWDPEELQSLASGMGLDSTTAGSPAEALAKAREMALERGGAVIITGSHFLFAPGEGAAFPA
jgi:dihydrofolate synthase/folylpolyglutamate synthase